MNVHPVGAELSLVDGRRDRHDKAISHLINSTKAPLFPLEHRTSVPNPFRPQNNHYTDCATPEVEAK